MEWQYFLSTLIQTSWFTHNCARSSGKINIYAPKLLFQWMAFVNYESCSGYYTNVTFQRDTKNGASMLKQL